MTMMKRAGAIVGVLCIGGTTWCQGPDRHFEQLARRYLDEFSKFSPVSATELGDHRYDDQLDDIGASAREAWLDWLNTVLDAAESIPAGQLQRAHQVDLALLKHRLRSRIWSETELQEWAWNPLVYTGTSGTSIYSLMARDFAPAAQRLNHVGARLMQFPRFLRQVRATLALDRVPEIHARTAAAQNRGVLTIIDEMVKPQLDVLPAAEQTRLTNAIDIATEAINEHQTWLDEEVVPRAKASYRIPQALYDQKLAYTLYSPLTRPQIRATAERRVQDLHRQMFELAAPIYSASGNAVPSSPTDQQRKQVIRFALEQAYAETPAADELVSAAKQSARICEQFIRDKQLISMMPDPLEITLMPEFRRGVSVAYCDSPGPLDVGQKTFYAVSPIPEDWTDEQTHSFLREYNTRSLHVLTIHEALPGHYLQLAHANRYQGRLRHLFHSGPFIEGWACYTEGMMCEEGFLDDDPLMKLITLKWYLRDATNAILDSSIHVDGMTRDAAMRLMMDDAFQEEREAAGKWKRAQLTSAQLSTYFVGYLEHIALRKEAEEKWGESFRLKEYHDKLLSYAAPPPQFVRALLFGLPIPE